MSTMARRSSFYRILVDLNTQYDFLLPRGVLPVANRAEVLPNIRKLMNWGRVEQVPIISTLESHRPGEVLRGFPPHCVDRTPGQRKLPFTMMTRRLMLVGDNTMDVPMEPFRRYQQLIFTKRNRDFLTNPKADRLINTTQINHVVLFGVVTEYCIKAAALGLLARQHRVAVVTDACGCWSAADHDLALRQMEAKGAILVTTDELINKLADERIQAAPRPEPATEEIAADGSRSNGNGNGQPFGSIRPALEKSGDYAAVKVNGKNGHGNGHANGSGTRPNRPFSHPSDLVPKISTRPSKSAGKNPGISSDPS